MMTTTTPPAKVVKEGLTLVRKTHRAGLPVVMTHAGRWMWFGPEHCMMSCPDPLGLPEGLSLESPWDALPVIDDPVSWENPGDGSLRINQYPVSLRTDVWWPDDIPSLDQAGWVTRTTISARELQYLRQFRASDRDDAHPILRHIALVGSHRVATDGSRLGRIDGPLTTDTETVMLPDLPVTSDALVLTHGQRWWMVTAQFDAWGRTDLVYPTFLRVIPDHYAAQGTWTGDRVRTVVKQLTGLVGRRDTGTWALNGELRDIATRTMQTVGLVSADQAPGIPIGQVLWRPAVMARTLGAFDPTEPVRWQWSHGALGSGGDILRLDQGRYMAVVLSLRYAEGGRRA